MKSTMDLQIFYSSLDTDELEVEFEVRGMTSTTVGVEKKFQEMVQRESLNVTVKPKVSHVKDHPEVEWNIVSQKTVELGDVFDQTEDSPILDKRKLLFRICHYRDRAQRLSCSFPELGGTTMITNSLERLARFVSRDIKKVESSSGPSKKSTRTKSQSQKIQDLIETDFEGARSDIETPNQRKEIEHTLEKRFSKQLDDMSNKFMEELAALKQQASSRPEYTDKKTAYNQDLIETDPGKDIERTLEKRFSKQLDDMSKKLMKELAVLKPKSPSRTERTDKRETNKQGRYYGTDSDSERGRTSEAENRNTSRPFVSRYRRRIDPTKWKLTFSGRDSKRGEENIQDFITRLEDHAYQDDISNQELVTLMRNFVSDKADIWYYNFIRKNKHATWRQMKEALLERFGSMEGDRETRRYLRGRVQYPKESFNDFLAEIEHTNYRLTNPLPDEEILEILRDNMNPALKSAIQHLPVSDIPSLRKICDNFERLWSTSGFDPRILIETRSRRITSIAQIVNNQAQEPGPSHTPLAVSYNSEDESNTSKPSLPDIEAINRQTYVVCWNCKDLGHKFTTCKMVTTHNFCEGCGLANCNINTCFRCKQRRIPGNLRPNVTSSGESRSVNLPSPRSNTNQ